MLFIITRSDNTIYFAYESEAMEHTSYFTKSAELESVNIARLGFLFKNIPAGKKLLSLVGVGEKLLKIWDEQSLKPWRKMSKKVLGAGGGKAFRFCFQASGAQPQLPKDPAVLGGGCGSRREHD